MKIAGFSKDMVDQALNLDRKTAKLPKLRAMIPKVGMYKVDMVATLADEKSDVDWAKRVGDMSKNGLRQLVKEIRCEKKQVKPQMKILLDAETELLFHQAKKKFGKNLSDQEALRRMLKKLVDESLPGQKCVYPGCNKPSEEKHHPHRKSEGGKGTATVAVCRAHHEFSHNGLIKDESGAVWELDYKNYRAGGWADQGYRAVRRNL